MNGRNKPTLGIDWAGVGVLFAIIGAVGGMALAPIYILSGNNSKAIEKLQKSLEDHVNLPSHPVIQMKVDTEVKRLDAQITAERESVASLWTDNKRIETMFESEKAETKSKFTEVETQFDADNQLRNIQFSDMQRKFAELQDSLRELGGKLPPHPTAPYFEPNISNRHGDR